MKQLLYAAYATLATLIPCHAQAQLVINEFMQSNVDCIMDDQNEFPDSWVELYNPGNSAVNLSGYSISADGDATQAWKLPNQQVGPKRYVVVYCDKVASKLHTNFKLDSGKGGAIYLFNNGNIADKIENIAKQPAPNISYGRQTDGSDILGYQQTPTPNAANCGRICTEILGEPVFSQPGMVLASSKTVKVELSLPEGSPAGTIIKVTYDGSEPTKDSPTYSGPISVFSTRIIRAKLFCDGYLSPRATTHSYIFHGRQVTLPVVSIVTNDKYFNDNKIGIYVKGTYNSSTANYKYNWRRPINIELFEGEDVESSINQVCETRVQGGASRDSQLKSLAVYANKRFGKKRFDYEFFPDQRPGMTDFKSIILRNAGNDFDYLYMRDAIIQRTMAENTDLDWQAWRPSIIYINGVYKGMLNIRERSTADNIYSNYNGLEDIDMIENWNQLKEGDTQNWEEFKNFYAEHGHTLEEYAKWIDWKEFINLMIMNLYYNNQDFPGNNIVMWRPRQEGGVWRFVAKDTDFGIGLYGSKADYNSIEWIYNPNYDSNRNWANQYEHTRLFRRMMDDTDFKREFIDRAAIYMGDFLNSAGTRAVWDLMYEQIKTEYPHHRALINRWWPDYNQELATGRTWLSQRTNHFYTQLANYYKLGTPTAMQINAGLDADQLEAVKFSINGVELTKGIFDGKFFTGRDITIEGTPVDGKKVTGWKIITVGSGQTTTENIQGSKLSFTMPTCLKIMINAEIDTDDGISELAENMTKWHIDNGVLTIADTPKGKKIAVYGQDGIEYYTGITMGKDITVNLPAKGVYIIKIGNKSFKVR